MKLMDFISSIGETYMTLLIVVPNGSLKQYYYNVIKELYNIGLSDISTTECFYFDVLYCYERMLDVGKCVDNLIELQGERNEIFKRYKL